MTIVLITKEEDKLRAGVEKTPSQRINATKPSNFE